MIFINLFIIEEKTCLIDYGLGAGHPHDGQHPEKAIASTDSLTVFGATSSMRTTGL